MPVFQPQSSSSLPSNLINYFSSNPDAENDVAGWSTFADAASTTPTDGTGGAPNSTWTRSTSSPLMGQGSFLFTKSSGASRQGEGSSFDFTIDSAFKGKVLRGYFDYTVASGTFADDDLTVWIYDVTNAVMIQPAPYKIKNVSTASERFFFEFQAASNSTSYRFILFVPVTTNSANVLKFDNFNLGPGVKEYGSPVTDWVSFTPTGAWVSNTTYTGYWRREGDSLRYIVYITLAGAPTSAGLTVNYLPSGLTVDTTKIGATVGSVKVGDGFTKSAGTSYKVECQYNTTTVLTVIIPNAASTSLLTSSAVTQALPATYASGDNVYITGIVPISGWSSSVLMSSDADTRVCIAQITGNPASATVGNPIIVPTVNFDTHGSYNASTGRYTCSVAGYYKMYGSGASASGAGISLTIYKNAVAQTDTGYTDSNSEITYTGLVSCIAGDIIDLRPSATYDASAFVLNIERLSGPSQIAASEKVYAYKAADTPTGTLASSYNVVKFTGMTKDSHGGYNASTGLYTIQSAGTYRVSSTLNLAKTSFAANDQQIIAIYKNGAAIAYGGYSLQGTVTRCVIVINELIDLVAGDTIGIYVYTNATGVTYSTSDTGSNFGIQRI